MELILLMSFISHIRLHCCWQ